jgi:hypothetical protein
VRDVLHGDNDVANLLVTAPVDSFIPADLIGGGGGGGGGGEPGILLADARRIIVEAMEGQGPAVMWMSRMPEDAPKSEICEAVLDSCEGLIAEVGLSQNALRLAIDSCQRAVAASVEDTLAKARQEANKTLGNMRLELKDAWAAVAATRTRQAALQESLTLQAVKSRRLVDRLASNGGAVPVRIQLTHSFKPPGSNP